MKRKYDFSIALWDRPCFLNTMMIICMFLDGIMIYSAIKEGYTNPDLIDQIVIAVTTFSICMLIDFTPNFIGSALESKTNFTKKTFRTMSIVLLIAIIILYAAVGGLKLASATVPSTDSNTSMNAIQAVTSTSIVKDAETLELEEKQQEEIQKAKVSVARWTAAIQIIVPLVNSIFLITVSAVGSGTRRKMKLYDQREALLEMRENLFSQLSVYQSLPSREEMIENDDIAFDNMVRQTREYVNTWKTNVLELASQTVHDPVVQAGLLEAQFIDHLD